MLFVGFGSSSFHIIDIWLHFMWNLDLLAFLHDKHGCEAQLPYEHFQRGVWCPSFCFFLLVSCWSWEKLVQLIFLTAVQQITSCLFIFWSAAWYFCIQQWIIVLQRRTTNIFNLRTTSPELYGGSIRFTVQLVVFIIPWQLNGKTSLLALATTSAGTHFLRGKYEFINKIENRTSLIVYQGDRPTKIAASLYLLSDI